MQVHHPGLAVFPQLVSHGVQQMGLSQASSAIKQQWIVGPMAWVLGYLQGGGVRHLIGLTLDKVVEPIGNIQIAGPARVRRRFHGLGFNGFLDPMGRPHMHLNTYGGARQVVQNLLNEQQVSVPQCIEHKRVGSHQGHAAVIKPRLQRSDPHIHFLPAQLTFQSTDTPGPQLIAAHRFFIKMTISSLARRAARRAGQSTARFVHSPILQ